MCGSMEEGTSAVQMVTAVSPWERHAFLVRGFLVQPFMVLPVLTLVVKEPLNQELCRACRAVYSLLFGFRPSTA